MRRILPKRNGKLFDIWSLLHLFEGVILGWLLPPFVALSLLVLWEPIEILILSPWLWKSYKIVFGHESIRNSLSDIIFDTLGVAIGVWLLTPLAAPPIHLF